MAIRGRIVWVVFVLGLVPTMLLSVMLALPAGVTGSNQRISLSPGMVINEVAWGGRLKGAIIGIWLSTLLGAAGVAIMIAA